MTAWWSGRAVLLDLETDGVDPTDARIITAAVADVGNDVSGVTTWLAKTERPIPPGATEIHHTTTEYADTNGHDRETVVMSIAYALTAPRGDGVPVIGHNVRFDLTIIDREMRRLGVGSLGTEGATVTVRMDGKQAGAFHVIDTLCLDKHVDPYRRGRRTLDATAQYYGVPIRGDAHTAEADALAAGRVAWAIAKRCDMAADYYATFGHEPQIDPEFGFMRLYGDRRKPLEVLESFATLSTLSLPDLHRAQIGWAREQANGLHDYFTRNPDKGDPNGVSGMWPLEPVGTVDAATDYV